jgi:acetyl-CoA C-acetyltransferase
MTAAYIVDAIRTPTGRRDGGLSQVHPADLGGHVIKALLDRTGVDPGAVEDVIFGCVDQVGSQAGNVARTAWLSAGLPEEVPGTTLDRQCGSSQQAAHFAAQAVMSGTQDLIVAGGVEVMSKVPIASSAIIGAEAGYGAPMDGAGWIERYGTQEITQFRGAELICERWGIQREELEELAYRSHKLAASAWEAGHFDAEVTPYGDVHRDEGFRPDVSKEKMASLKPLAEGGTITAAVASQISDGAAAMLVASEDAVRRYNLEPLARFHTLSVVGSDPVFMLTGPIPATEHALKRSGLSIGDIDRFEVNEAFAPVVLAWLKDTGADLERTNVHGGAIALGHPLGATGAKLMATLVHELQRSGGRYGLQTMCEGGGMANATIIERV